MSHNDMLLGQRTLQAKPVKVSHKVVTPVLLEKAHYCQNEKGWPIATIVWPTGAKGQRLYNTLIYLNCIFNLS